MNTLTLIRVNLISTYHKITVPIAQHHALQAKLPYTFGACALSFSLSLSVFHLCLSRETSVIAAEGGWWNCVNVSQDFELTPFRVIATRTAHIKETPSELPCSRAFLLLPFPPGSSCSSAPAPAPTLASTPSLSLVSHCHPTPIQAPSPRSCQSRHLNSRLCV